MDSIEELKKKHEEETAQFIEDCPHPEVLIEDTSVGSRQRNITIRCKRCRLNLLTYIIDGSQSYVSYVRDCVGNE